MNAVIIYQSLHGHAKEYAYLLRDELKLDCFSLNDIKEIDFNQYQEIIFFGWICNSEVQGLKKIKKIFLNLNLERLLVCGVGMSLIDAEYFNVLKIKNMSKKIQNQPFFYLRGGFSMMQCSKAHKKSMKYTQKFLIKRGNLSQNEKEIIQMFAAAKNYVSLENLQPVLTYIFENQ